eukprot:TRINITY_DN48862_c0_g1_i1.p1 TRINITY_DN48862_c0_g1~~TRINITY_DN48862_c0_g1_i1.p1  ORF type:complete len:1158 (-),score=205.64 TRINITY_DN48862_c0_g1_i1:43-3054(-)
MAAGVASSQGSPAGTSFVSVASCPSPPVRGSWRSESPAKCQGNSFTRGPSIKGHGGDVSLCVRLRPPGSVASGAGGELREAASTCTVEGGNSVRLRHLAGTTGPPSAGHRTDSSTGDSGSYRCDMAFGPDATQEQVYTHAVTPICDAVLKGYNGAVIAFGQTGSGKTHTMLGDTRGSGMGMAPRAVSRIFADLQRLPSWRVEVTVLEIYNERVRDLLSQGTSVANVEVHEIRLDGAGGPATAAPSTFRCPDATCRLAPTPEDALAALQEGMRRRETARTDMNHSSSRSHLIFTLCVSQSDREAGATLRSRLHLVDLAGSERLKRSMASETPAVVVPFARAGSRGSTSPRSPRDQRREAAEINRSLSQLALVIQRLTTSGSSQYVPYRDSMLTRLLAESFGGSSKTCLIITCSGLPEDREETKCSLDFGRRAKLVKNQAEINLELQFEPSMVFKAMITKETEALRKERDALLAERELRSDAERLLKEATADAKQQQEERANHVTRLEEENGDLQRRLEEMLSKVQGLQETSVREMAKAEDEKAELRRQLESAAAERLEVIEKHEGLVRGLERDKTELRRRCEMSAVEVARFRQRQEELTRMMEERALEFSRLEGDKATLQLNLESLRTRSRQQETLASQLEAQKISVHQQWHAAVTDAWKLLQDRSPHIMQTQLLEAPLNVKQQSTDELFARSGGSGSLRSAVRSTADQERHRQSPGRSHNDGEPRRSEAEYAQLEAELYHLREQQRHQQPPQQQQQQLQHKHQQQQQTHGLQQHAHQQRRSQHVDDTCSRSFEAPRASVSATSATEDTCGLSSCSGGSWNNLQARENVIDMVESRSPAESTVDAFATRPEPRRVHWPSHERVPPSSRLSMTDGCSGAGESEALASSVGAADGDASADYGSAATDSPLLLSPPTEHQLPRSRLWSPMQSVSSCTSLGPPDPSSGVVHAWHQAGDIGGGRRSFQESIDSAAGPEEQTAPACFGRVDVSAAAGSVSSSDTATFTLR